VDTVGVAAGAQDTSVVLKGGSAPSLGEDSDNDEKDLNRGGLFSTEEGEGTALLHVALAPLCVWGNT